MNDRLDPIRKASKQQLTDRDWLERAIARCGLATLPEDLPLEMRQFRGGMEIWQHPCQLAPYLIWLSDKRVESYAEIGLHKGGTFAFTATYLDRFHSLRAVLGIDIMLDPGLASYDLPHPTFLNVSSDSPEFVEYIRGFKPDLVFIDAVHTVEACRSDYEISSGARFVGFHDIVDYRCGGVREVWDSLAGNKLEFTDQYEDGQSVYGIGLLS